MPVTGFEPPYYTPYLEERIKYLNMKRFYKRIDFGPDTYPAGGVARSAPLAPGGSVRDILIFERPSETTGPYRLELPLGNLGGVGLAAWEIPESALR